jgi:squalene synthase HpnC
MPAIAEPPPPVLDPRTPPVELLRVIGPPEEREGDTSLEPISDAAAVAYCRGLATGHYENFSVLSRLVPAEWRDDYAAVYAFCRWADDLGDETGADEAARERSLRLLAWWRSELTGCFSPNAEAPPPMHPVYIALRRTLRTRADRGDHALTAEPFHNLISAFEMDQRVRAYSTWHELVGYCRLSADPVGRIVLALGGYAPPDQAPANAERYRLSDLTCTALQLVNFWQDVRRDLLERDRVYLPRIDTGLTPETLRDWAARPDDPRARVPYIAALRPLVERTGALFREGNTLPRHLDARLAPVVRLFGLGGEAILRAVERGGCATLWHRPRLSKAQKAGLVLRTMVGSRLGGWGS